MKALKSVYHAVFNPSPEHASRSLLLVVVFWGLPSLAMLLVPAFMWQSDQQISVPMFACMAFGLILLLAYGRFVIDFIKRYNGENWMRDQLMGDDE